MGILKTPVGAAGSAVITVLVAVAALAPVLATHDPKAPSGFPLDLPSARHLLGTDGIGRDLFSQLVWGARSSLTVAVAVTGISLLASLAVGVGGGYLGGLAGTVAARVTDVFVAAPRLPVILIVAALAGGGRTSVIVVIALFSWAPGARILRSQTLSLRQRGYVGVAGGLGGGPLYVMRRHLVPALGPLVIAIAVAVAAGSVLAEAGLSFLGIGDPGGVSWGMTLNRAQFESQLFLNPIWKWWVLPPALAISSAVFGFALLGLAFEPVMNPRAAQSVLSGRSPGGLMPPSPLGAPHVPGPPSRGGRR